MRIPLINASLLGLCIACTTQAEETKLDQAIAHTDDAIEEIQVIGLSRYSATKSDTPVMDTPRSISVINEQAIIDKGAASLSDATAYNAGVTANAYGFATRGDWIKVRGIDAPTYQDSLQALFGSYNNSRLPVYGVEQIEILKGPSAVLYGAGAAGGIVNVVTKKPQAESKGEIALEYGTFDRKQLATDWTGSFDESGEFLYRFVGLVRDSETQVDYVKDDAIYISPSFTWQPSEQTALTALATYNKTESDAAAQFLPIKGTLTAAPNGKKIDPSTYLGEPEFNKYNTESSSITLLGEHQVNDVWSFLGTARYSEGKADYNQAFISLLPDTPNLVQDRYLLFRPDGMMPREFLQSKSTSSQWATDIRSLAEFNTGSIGHKIIIGLQHQEVTLNEKRSQTSNPDTKLPLGIELTGNPLNPMTFDDTYWINVFDPKYGNVPSADILNRYSKRRDSKTQSTGLYITEQLTIENLLINGGVRYDHITSTTGTDPKQNDEALSLSAGAMYQFDFGLSPYISYADSFEAVAGIDDGTNKSFKPKESKQLEAGIKYQPEGQQSFITAAYFNIDQKNLPNPAATIGTSSQLGKLSYYYLKPVQERILENTLPNYTSAKI